MRTTVTLDPDTEQLVRARMQVQAVSFKRALNDAIRAGAVAGMEQFRTRTCSMGQPAVDLDHALQLSSQDEDQELVSRMRAVE